jgi:hypothetical protein
VPKAPYHRRPAGVCCYHRDDGSRLALHWAAELGMVEVTQLLLQETVAAAQQLRQQMEAAGDTADSYAPMNVVQIQVRSQPPCRALHALRAACRALHALESCQLQRSRPVVNRGLPVHAPCWLHRVMRWYCSVGHAGTAGCLMCMLLAGHAWFQPAALCSS